MVIEIRPKFDVGIPTEVIAEVDVIRSGVVDIVKATTGFSTGITLSTGITTLLLASNPSRKSVLIQNIGNNPFTLGLNPGVTHTSGILIYPNCFWGSDNYTGHIYGISSGSTVVAVMEIR